MSLWTLHLPPGIRQSFCLSTIVAICTRYPQRDIQTSLSHADISDFWLIGMNPSQWTFLRKVAHKIGKSHKNHDEQDDEIRKNSSRSCFTHTLTTFSGIFPDCTTGYVLQWGVCAVHGILLRGQRRSRSETAVCLLLSHDMVPRSVSGIVLLYRGFHQACKACPLSDVYQSTS